MTVRVVKRRWSPCAKQVLLGHEGLSDGFKVPLRCHPDPNPNPDASVTLTLVEVDENGWIWSSMPNGLVVFDPERREVMFQVRTYLSLPIPSAAPDFPALPADAT